MLSYHDLPTTWSAFLGKFFGRPDLERWVDPSNYDDWEERTRIIAGLVPAGARVIEFGAGGRRLERYLDPSCHYVPSDIVSRGPDTIVLDLNIRPLPDLGNRQFDVAIFAGVLEYIADLASFLPWLGRQSPVCIASYGCAASKRRSMRRMLENVRRAGAGWINSYTEEELLALFKSAGFGLKVAVDWHTPEGSERIFRWRTDGLAVLA